MPLTAVLLVIALIAAWMATDFSRDASIAPLFATAGLLLATVADVVRTVVRRRRGRAPDTTEVALDDRATDGSGGEGGVRVRPVVSSGEEEAGGELLTRGMLVSLLWFAGFLVSVYLLGIVVGGAVFAALFVVGWGRRRIWQAALFAAILGTGVHVGFSVLLGLRLYAGVWPLL